MRKSGQYNGDAVTVDSCKSSSFYLDNRGFQFINQLGDFIGEYRIMAAWIIDFEGPVPIGTDTDGTGEFAKLFVRFNQSGTHWILFRRDIDPLNQNRPRSYLGDISGYPMESNWDSLFITIR